MSKNKDVSTPELEQERLREILHIESITLAAIGLLSFAGGDAVAGTFGVTVGLVGEILSRCQMNREVLSFTNNLVGYAICVTPIANILFSVLPDPSIYKLAVVTAEFGTGAIGFHLAIAARDQNNPKP